MMQRDRYQFLCSEADAGRDAFVRNPNGMEEGMVTSCIMQSDHLVVKTTAGQTRCWDYHECEDLQRPKSGPMI